MANEHWKNMALSDLIIFDSSQKNCCDNLYCPTDEHRTSVNQQNQYQKNSLLLSTHQGTEGMLYHVGSIVGLTIFHVSGSIGYYLFTAELVQQKERKVYPCRNPSGCV